MVEVPNMARRGGGNGLRMHGGRSCGGAEESWMLASGGWKLDATKILMCYLGSAACLTIWCGGRCLTPINV